MVSLEALHASEAAFGRMQLRVSELVDQNRLEDAYREASAFHAEGRLTTGADPLVDTALLTGRYREAASLIADYERRQRDEDGGAYWTALSLASAMDGVLYPGQGEYSLQALRSATRTAGQAADIGDSAALRPVALANVLTLGLRSQPPYSAAYLEWALRMDPSCTLASRRLADYYSVKHRDADYVRVSTLLVRSLPAGREREGCAQRLREAQARLDAAQAKPGG